MTVTATIIVRMDISVMGEGKSELSAVGCRLSDTVVD